MKLDGLNKEEILKDKIIFKDESKGYVYFLINADEIIYVGSSLNAESRIQSHRDEGRIPFDSYYILQSNNHLANEIKYIIKFNPIYNISVALKHLPGVGLISQTALNKVSFSINESICTHRNLIRQINLAEGSGQVQSFFFDSNKIYTIPTLLNTIKDFYCDDIDKHKSFICKFQELALPKERGVSKTKLRRMCLEGQ